MQNKCLAVFFYRFSELGVGVLDYPQWQKMSLCFGFSLRIRGIWYILHVSIRWDYYYFNVHIVPGLASGISLKLIPVFFWLTAVSLWILLCFYVQRGISSFPRKVPCSSVLLPDLQIDPRKNSRSSSRASSEVWRLSITSVWGLFFKSLSLAFTYKLVFKAHIFTYTCTAFSLLSSITTHFLLFLSRWHRLSSVLVGVVRLCSLGVFQAFAFMSLTCFPAGRVLSFVVSLRPMPSTLPALLTAAASTHVRTSWRVAALQLFMWIGSEDPGKALLVDTVLKWLASFLPSARALEAELSLGFPQRPVFCSHWQRFCQLGGSLWVESLRRAHYDRLCGPTTADGRMT